MNTKSGKTRVVVLRWLRRTLLALLLLAIVGGVAMAWIPRPIPVDVATATKGPLRVLVEEDGRARVKDRYIVSAPLNGSLARIELEPGDRIEQGQVLIRLVPLMPPLLDERTRSSAQAQLAAAQAAQHQVQSQIERAKASAEYAKKEAERLTELEKRGSIARAELERSLLEARSTDADLDSLKFGARVADYEAQMAAATLKRLTGDRKGGKQQEQLEVPSPVAGRVLRVMQKSEGVVQAGTPLLEVGDPAALEVAVDVLTADAVEIHPGATVTLDRWGGPALDARVRRIEPSAFTRVGALGVEEQRVNVLIDVVAPREQWTALGDGYRVEAHVVVWEGKDVLSVPASAVFRRGDDWILFRAEGGRAQETRVKLGHRTSQRVEITGGLEAGASVIVHPSDSIKSGVEVAAR